MVSRRETVVFLCSIISGNQCWFLITTKEFLSAIFSRSENIYGYESKGLINSLYPRDLARL